jgi:hypothetical protein
MSSARVGHPRSDQRPNPAGAQRQPVHLHLRAGALARMGVRGRPCRELARRRHRAPLRAALSLLPPVLLLATGVVFPRLAEAWIGRDVGGRFRGITCSRLACSGAGGVRHLRRTLVDRRSPLATRRGWRGDPTQRVDCGLKCPVCSREGRSLWIRSAERRLSGEQPLVRVFGVIEVVPIGDSRRRGVPYPLRPCREGWEPGRGAHCTRRRSGCASPPHIRWWRGDPCSH